jgi:hypothetical protein
MEKYIMKELTLIDLLETFDKLQHIKSYYKTDGASETFSGIYSLTWKIKKGDLTLTKTISNSDLGLGNKALMGSITELSPFLEMVVENFYFQSEIDVMNSMFNRGTTYARTNHYSIVVMLK